MRDRVVRSVLLSLIALTMLVASVVPALAEPDTRAADLARRLDQHVRTYMATARQPGLAAVVVQGDRVLLSAGYGFADREAGRPMTSDTPVAIGSTTKGMTALAVMQLVEQGLVDLDAPVVDYVPDFTMADARYTRITLRQLLSMSAGLPASNALDGNQDPDALEREIAGLASVRLHRDPGSGFEYANDGFNLAGLVVQRVSGAPYEQYLAEHLFAPLGMAHTTFDPWRGAELGLAQGYGPHHGVAVPLRTPFTRGFMPTGGAMTSADDVGRYLRALLNGGTEGAARILSPESVNAMWTPTFRTGDKTAVGLGWMLEDVDGHQGWTWTGNIGVSSSVFLVLPDRGLGVAVMANYRSDPSLNQLAEDVVTIALGGEPPARQAPIDDTHVPKVEPDRSAWASYVGLYTGERDAIRVSPVGDHLVATIAGGDILASARAFGPDERFEADLVPTSATEFVSVGDTALLDGAPVAFKLAPDGKPVLILGGAPFGSRQGDPR
jgi:CubicO group peptidase (beta-lactamase class C family)